jgi:hypothetical protein
VQSRQRPRRSPWLRYGLPGALTLLCAAGASASLAAGTPDEAATDPEASMTAVAETGEAAAQPLRYEGDRLTGDVVDMSLHAMLMEIGRQSGARVRIEGVVDRDVSGRFPGLPLYEGLRRVLGGDNFTLVYARGSGGDPGPARLKEIQVFGGGDGPSVTNGGRADARTAPVARSGGAATPVAGGGGMMEELSLLLQKHSAIPLRPGSALAATLGGEQASFQDLLGFAIRENNGALRFEAAQVLANVFDSDPDARGMFGGRQGDADTEALASLVRASGSPFAEQFLAEVARNLRTPALRIKLTQIRAKLREDR